MLTNINLVEVNAQIQSKHVNTMQLKVEDGLAMSRVDDIVCDNQNIIWIKSSRGLQFWDGQSIHTFQDSFLNVGTQFHMYPHSEEGIIVSMPGLVRQFTFEGLKTKTIYQSNNSKKGFIPIPLPSQSSGAVIIHPDSIFYRKANGSFTSQYIEKQTEKAISSLHQYIFDGTNYILDFSSKKVSVNNSSRFKKIIPSLFNNRIRNSILINDNEVIYSTKRGLHISADSNKAIFPYPNKLNANYYSSIHKISENIILVGIDNMLYEFDLQYKKWTTIYKKIDQSNLLQTGYFDKLILDKYNNIWVITVNEGLLKIYNNDSFNYYGSNDIKLNFVKNIVADEGDNRIITASLNGGILVYDTLGNQTHHLQSKNTKGLVNSVTGIYKIDENQYIYNNHMDSMIYGLTFRNDKAVIKPLQAKSESYVYYQDAQQLDDNTSLLLFNTLYELQHIPFKLTSVLKYHSTKSCMIRDGDEIWIGCIDGILKYKIGSDNDYEFYSLPGEGYVRSISTWKDNTLALGTDRGLSIFDKASSKLSHKVEDCIYCLLSDDDFNIWAGTGSGIIKLDQDFKKTQYSIIDGLQNNEFNTNACVKSASGKMYFGGLNGITSFDPKTITTKKHTSSLFIKNLEVDNMNLVTNSRIGNIDKLILAHDQNNLSLSVGTIGKFESNTYNYQYYVEGLTSKWVDAKHLTNYNFNLLPGEYNFYVIASNAFAPNAKLENPILIKIKNPWWKQWWFYLISICTLIGIITYIIRAKEKQKYLKKKFEWDLEYQRQEDRIEMSKELHDNIGSRLTFLISSIENVKKTFQLNPGQAIKKIDDLSDFGKGTIDDLRSMMWVLNQQTITVQDLQLKVLDYLNIAKNTYKNIDIQYDGPQTDLDSKLESKLSQNIFRVIQESIHNSIKHADPTEITVKIATENQKIRVSIEDNGKGFDMQNVKYGNGLYNMKSRLKEHKSEINITSEIGQGTMLQFEVDMKD